MSVERIEFLVEETSMEAALRLLAPRLIGNLSFEVHPHRCKDDLLKNLPARLRGYAAWIPETWRIVVVVDRDDDDCLSLKSKLEAMAAGAQLPTRATAREQPQVVVNRIAIEELEAWYFGDWAAVRAAYPKVPESIPARARYRAPDNIRGTCEAFERVLQDAGYFRGGLRKIEAARAVAAKMEPSRNLSPSFCALRDSLASFLTDP